MVKKALDTFGKEAEGATTLADDPNAAYKIVGTDTVGPIAGDQLRNQAVIATLLGLAGILFFIAFRYDWTYAAGAVIAVFHDVLITLAFFSVFQWEVNLTVLAALLTLVGFSVNDSIVIFDRIRETLTLHRGESLYKLTNDSINQTMSRTIVTNGLVFLSVLALVWFGGEVLRGFSLALFVGSITGTYSTIAIASPIAIWWQGKIGAAQIKEVEVPKAERLASASRRPVSRRPVTPPIVRPTIVRALGRAPLPAVRRVSFDDLVTGREDSQWVEIVGLVRTVHGEAANVKIFELAT